MKEWREESHKTFRYMIILVGIVSLFGLFGFWIHEDYKADLLECPVQLHKCEQWKALSQAECNARTRKWRQNIVDAIDGGRCIP